MEERRALVLHAFAHHRELGVMLIQPAAIEAHHRSRSRKSLADWIERIAPHKGKEQDPEHRRLWLRIRADATRELDRAVHDFDLRWRRG